MKNVTIQPFLVPSKLNYNTDINTMFEQNPNMFVSVTTNPHTITAHHQTENGNTIFIEFKAVKEEAETNPIIAINIAGLAMGHSFVHNQYLQDTLKLLKIKTKLHKDNNSSKLVFTKNFMTLFPRDIFDIRHPENSIKQGRDFENHEFKGHALNSEDYILPLILLENTNQSAHKRLQVLKNVKQTIYNVVEIHRRGVYSLKIKNPIQT